MSRGARAAGALALSVLLGLAPDLGADTVVLRDGDRISGRIVAKGTRRIRLKTPYGVLAIPRERIEKIVREDGTEEILGAPAAVLPSAPPPVRLQVVVSGATFWQAWNPKGGAPADPSLRLEVRLDDRPVAYYVDAALDPADMPGAVVNSFSFTAESLRLQPVPPAQLAPAEIRPGRIQLELRLPAAQAGTRRLGLAYQVNDGPADAPAWRDVVRAGAEVELRVDVPRVVQLRQDRGRMEYSRRRMKNVETFHLVAVPE